MVTALRKAGFAKVFDTNFTADLTIIEEGNEFLERLKKNERLPLITSCSPGWIGYLERFYPELIPLTSSCKSPMSMLSTILKTYYAQRVDVDPKKIFVVSAMPCTAKKYEASREEHMTPWGAPYTDVVITTRGLIWTLKCLGIDFHNLEDDLFDSPLGVSSGAADIFGTTGGVMEAALRTVYENVTSKELTDLNFEVVRGVEGVKEATIDIDGLGVYIAVSNGLANAKYLLDKVISGEKQYHVIEIMACPGGCIGGGGQPFPPQGMNVLDPDLLRMRAKALYSIDGGKTLRKSHDNPAIDQIYEDFLGAPGSHLCHELLHTSYKPKYPRGSQSRYIRGTK